MATFDSGNPSPPELPQERGSTPKLEELRRPAFIFDRQGWTQAIGGLVIALIALYSSYDHISLPAFQIRINQQWGVWFIAASLAFVLIDAQLATGSRLRAAEARERQGQGIALLRGAALLSARYQLDPTELNRSRLSAYLALLSNI